MGAAQGAQLEQGPGKALRIASAARTGTDLLGEYVKACKGKRALRRILIASNGMAATKCMMSLRQWAYMESGLDKVFEFVAMATRDDLDANAEFIRLADVFVEVPPGKNVNNYANVDLICKIAVEQQVDAVWPGWGHASENPRLPAKLKELDVVFIGPNAKVMAALGDKIAAGLLAQTAGVPSIPWSGDGLTCQLTPEGSVPEDIFHKATIHSVEEAIKCADRIGYPVVLKASEGGGGKGIRMSNSREELEVHFVQVQAEVPGSPIFMMQLCTGARHIEVQIVGDEHGNVVALSGRDCSTQRRFQKIFEEAPPVVVPRARFREMERAAQRLTQSLGYVGAGTVEYLYNAETDQFYFLELNPRLQVEHPVTEMVTQVNVPATQLQVAMGIPLQNMPQIRRFYGKSEEDNFTPISFMSDDYVYPTVHCMAARITAENPDDGFKPTSGKIERVRFQSSVACWGYFSVSTHAAIHEFADSQFGHIFARGKDREEARKTLQLALKQVEIVGDIRTPVDYLVELLNTKTFINNVIDTSWLDGLIRAKSVKVQYSQSDVVFYAAVYKALQASRAKEGELSDALSKRRLGLLGQVKDLNTFEVEVTFEGTRYVFAVERSSADLFVFAIGGAKIVAQVRVQTDQSLLVGVGNTVTKVFGTEEALGLRLRLQGVGTIMLPTVYDASELRSEFNGKVIRYLHREGAEVQAGEAYVELEAMKMIMPLKASASGKISHLKGVGSIVQAGELLSKLELKDPSSVQKIVGFEGEFSIAAGSGSSAVAGGDALSRVLLTLDGYAPLAKPAKLAEDLLSSGSEEERIAAATSVIDRYLEVERSFVAHSSQGQSKDLVCAALIEANKDNPDAVCGLLRAHSQLPARNEVVLAVLKPAASLAATPGPEGGVLADRIQALATLPPEGGYGEVLLSARRIAESLGRKPFEERLAALREAVRAAPGDGLGKLSTAEAATAGTDLLAALLEDESEDVRTRALELYVRRTYRGFGVSKDSKVQLATEGKARLIARWRFRHPGVSVNSAAGMSVWLGCCMLVPDLASLQELLSGPITMSKDSSNASGPGRLQLVLGAKLQKELAEGAELPFESCLEKLQQLLRNKASNLSASSAQEVVVMAPMPPDVRYACFSQASGWSEEKLRRDLVPTAPCLLELDRLWEEYDLQRLIPAEAGGIQVFVGTKKDDPGSPAKGSGARGSKMQTIFARTFSHAPFPTKGSDEAWSKLLETLLFNALHEIECVCLNPKVRQGRSDSRIYLALTALVDLEATEMNTRLERFMAKFTSKHGASLQKLWVDEVVLKFRLGGESSKAQATLRFTASSMAGEYMKAVALLEQVDPMTGTPIRWCELASGKDLEPPVVANGSIQTRRIAARRAHSTYAPEFLGMLRAALVKQWAAHTRRMGGKGQVPFDMFKSKELLESGEGDLYEGDREPGSNTIGMLAWRCVLKTPEYPDGRSIVLIANDVTHQAGSFGVAEDVFFKKATDFARKRGLPRIYLACNSGARVGLVEELMSQINVKWIDPREPDRGFEYLYISKEHYAKLPEGAVIAREVADSAGGPPHYALEAVVGLGLPSANGGIGVENLQGSGLIAGCTSRAYSDIFTLSYVTGRSVGIGAYVNRLGHRTIQSKDGPMVLTGFSALNKLLGREVYSSQEQLGGPQVMVPNGVTHQLVQTDQEGAEAIINWLSYVPKDVKSPPPALPPHDPIGRPIDFVPTKSPYDPRHMLAGTTTPEGRRVTGFFDEGSFTEYLAGWGRSVVVGRARLGGIPMGVIAVETRNVERRIPADPGNPESREVLEPQAGQVWYPDSAYKTATAIRDFNNGEHLPLIIFANWRGFSGGTRDMYGEVLKFGAQIVDALVNYKQPVFIYIPPGGELRGGSWVVIDPAINPSVMEMYADVESRGGILEPSGVVEVKFRKPQRAELMHRLDAKLAAMDAQLARAGADQGEIKKQIATREAQLEPLYTQVACEFADLHDRSGRMKAIGAIREALEWKRAREYFYWRLRRRLSELRLGREVVVADPALTPEAAQDLVASWLPAKASDREAVELLEKPAVHAEVRKLHAASVRRRIAELRAELGEEEPPLLAFRSSHPVPEGRTPSCLLKCLGFLSADPSARGGGGGQGGGPQAGGAKRVSVHESPSARAMGALLEKEEREKARAEGAAPGVRALGRA